MKLNRVCGWTTRTSVSGNVRSEAVNICVFTESFTADLFLCSNDQNAFCLLLLQGNSFRKFDPFHVVSWFAATRALFLPSPLIDFLIFKPRWFDEDFAGLWFHLRFMFFPQLHGSFTSRHFSWSQRVCETTVYYLWCHQTTHVSQHF